MSLLPSRLTIATFLFSSGDVHEASYLPFLFSENDTINEPDKAATSSKPAGRRVFNRKGEEVSLVVISKHSQCLLSIIRLTYVSSRPHRQIQPVPTHLPHNPPLPRQLQGAKSTKGLYRYLPQGHRSSHEVSNN